MTKTQNLALRLSGSQRTAFGPEELTEIEAELFERWLSGVDDARKVVADQIVRSVRSKWGTAVALKAATGICPTEISRIRHGKFDRFSLERLVRLLCIIDPAVEVDLVVTLRSREGRSNQ
jgi:hypothetical protein